MKGGLTPEAPKRVGVVPRVVPVEVVEYPSENYRTGVLVDGINGC